MGDLKEKLILVGVSAKQEQGSEEILSSSLDELSELIETAGATEVGRLTQNVDGSNPGTYLGKGKIEELRIMINEIGATGIVCDDELSPAQMRTLGDMLDTKVMDRTLVILDIFAKHASTKEGKVQVELAQLRYRATHLTGMGNVLSRLGGGIGTRGPGESKLEMDKRVIRTRISQLKSELEEMKQHREVQRKQRVLKAIPVVCIAGYTNAGKSTLLNHLTKAGVYEQNQLFATLDPTTRNYTLPSGQEILLTDTVGFINKLPHHLVEAFRSTLEEAKYADIIVHVVDSCNKDVEMQMEAVYQTFHKLGIEGKTIITAYNKQDREDAAFLRKDTKADACVYISAKSGMGMEQLLDEIEQAIRQMQTYIDYVFSYQEAGLIQMVRSNGQLLSEEYEENGIHVTAYVPNKIVRQIIKE